MLRVDVISTNLTGNHAGRSGGGAYFSDVTVAMGSSHVASNRAVESGGGVAGVCNPFVGSDHACAAVC